MDIREAENYILGIPKFTKKNSLEHTKEFMRRLGEPWKGMKVVHVAGTNGKGSVCSYLQALLLAEGKRTGLFTSPHLIRMNERIRICGREVPDAEFLRGFSEVWDTVRSMEAEGIAHPTFFEFLFGMAMCIFRGQDMEYCILETGLGGRLDATNAVPDPALTIITSIGLDHTEYLGDTIREIALEKAGIIKPGVPLVFDGHEKDSRDVLIQIAEKKRSPCRKIAENAYEIRAVGQKKIAFSMANAYYGSTVWTVGTPALYQVHNAALSLTAMELLMGGKPPGAFAPWQEAFARTRWEGRMEEVKDGVFLDGAHNLPGIRAFTESAKRIAASPVVLLFSAAADKKHREMTDYLYRHLKPDLIIITKIPGSRGEDVSRLKEEFEQSVMGQSTGSNEEPVAGKSPDSAGGRDAGQRRRIIVIEDIQEAYRRAERERKGKGTLFAVGSLYLIGELKALFKEE